MSNSIAMPPQELATILSDLPEQEGVLVCNVELPVWDETAISRAFSTFQFSASPSDGSGLCFCHDESGTMVTYTGQAVVVSVGGIIVEAMSELLRVLSELGWDNIDVYSVNGDAFYTDLVGSMPATVDIHISLKDVPEDLGNEELTGFSAHIQSVLSNETQESSSSEFLTAFRKSEGIASTGLFEETTQTPLPAARILTLTTPSPVPETSSTSINQMRAGSYAADSLTIPVPQTIPDDDVIPIPEVHSTSRPAMGVAVTTVEHVRTTEPLSIPAYISNRFIGIESRQATINKTGQHASVTKPLHPTVWRSDQWSLNQRDIADRLGAIRCGTALFVKVSAGEKLSNEQLVSLKSLFSNCEAPEILQFIPGTHLMQWRLFDEITDNCSSVYRLDIARILAHSFWPELNEQELLLATALLLLVKVEADKNSVVSSLSDVLDILLTGTDWHHELAGRLSALTEDGFPGQRFASAVASVTAVIPESMHRLAAVITSLTPLLFMSDMDITPAASFSLGALVSTCRPTLVVIKSDGMDQGGLGDLLGQSLWRFLHHIYLSDRYFSGLNMTDTNNSEKDDRPVTQADLAKVYQFVEKSMRKPAGNDGLISLHNDDL